MNTSRLPAVALLAAIAVLPACHEASPVEAESAAASAATPTVSANASGPVYNMRVHDDYASFYASEWDGNSSRYVAVWISRAAPGPNARAHLSLYGSECTQSGPEWWDYECSYFQGWGTVPAQDVSGGFSSGLRVHTDLRGNSDFWLWGTEPGIVSVEFRRNGWYETNYTGTMEQRWGHYVTRHSGPRRSASATATGEVLGISVPEYGGGDLFSGRGVTLQFERAASN